jgi:predicted MFS family arabinose efflux permease
MPLRIWLILATATLARIGFGMQTQSVGAVGPSLVEAMGLAYVALGTLIGAYSLPGIAAALPGGWLIARMGDRRMVLASLAAMVVGGCVMAIAPSTPILLAGRVLSGTGAALLSVVTPKIVFDQVPPERLTIVMGGVIAGYPLGFAFALLFLPLLDSWRLAMGLCAVVCAVAFVAAFAVIKHSIPRSAASGAGAGGGFRLAPGTAVPLVLIALVWALYNGGFLIVFSFVPAFFVAHGLSLAQAGAMTSLSLYTMIPIAPFGGWLLARSVGVMPGILLTLACLAVLPLLLLTAIPPPALMIAFGVLVGLNSGPIFALAGQGLAPAERAPAMGILFTIFYVAMAAAPPLAGFARDATGSPAAPFAVAAAMLAAALLVQIAHGAGRCRSLRRRVFSLSRLCGRGSG